MPDDLMALAELAARVEGLSGPDREVDCLIRALIEKPRFPDAKAIRMGRSWSCAAIKGPGRGWRAYGMFFESRAYTASLDSAMTLMPADPWMEIKGPRKYLHIPSPVPNKWSATVSQWNHEDDATGWGATPALALTAACLRARARASQSGVA